MLRPYQECTYEDWPALRGNVSAAPVIGAIQRALFELTTQGGEKAVRDEPAVTPRTTSMQNRRAGRGVVQYSCMRRAGLYRGTAPLAYSSILAVGCCPRAVRANCRKSGDLDKPRFVLFFDEAHLLFCAIHQKPGGRIEQGGPA